MASSSGIQNSTQGCLDTERYTEMPGYRMMHRGGSILNSAQRCLDTEWCTEMPEYRMAHRGGSILNSAQRCLNSEKYQVFLNSKRHMRGLNRNDVKLCLSWHTFVPRTQTSLSSE